MNILKKFLLLTVVLGSVSQALGMRSLSIGRSLLQQVTRTARPCHDTVRLQKVFSRYSNFNKIKFTHSSPTFTPLHNANEYAPQITDSDTESVASSETEQKSAQEIVTVCVAITGFLAYAYFKKSMN